jgi:predicted component of type VI protein secretion system
MANTFFVLRVPGQPDQVLVWDTRTLSVGRAPENDLVIEDDEVSRKHAQFTNEGGAMQVGDYRTGNGTFVNGQRIPDKAQIQPGAVIAIGKLQMELRVSEDHPATLGHRLEYASQLKMAHMMPGAANMDGDRTILGMSDTQSADDEPFVVRPQRSARERARMGATGGGPEPRSLDAEFGDALGAASLELEDGIDLVDPAPAEERDPVTGEFITPPERPQTAPARARPAKAPAENELDPVQRMKKLKSLHESGLISDQEFAFKRAAILEDV